MSELVNQDLDPLLRKMRPIHCAREVGKSQSRLVGCLQRSQGSCKEDNSPLERPPSGTNWQGGFHILGEDESWDGAR
ncbi:hypothetical protein BRADI_5g13081v3 [Brachypodium distachyon]|uniref:Uncharacterized protein n=1 Tax=Brachypodium distachyon TaxID=15368 RepID=A0A2K2CGX4_BRADI|nr:hypothetical protein BRADI_5g13081v3 [Brachypodium distachyon]